MLGVGKLVVGGGPEMSRGQIRWLRFRSRLKHPIHTMWFAWMRLQLWSVLVRLHVGAGA
jgi:hypothetical protein